MYYQGMLVHQLCRATVAPEVVDQFNTRLAGLPEGFKRILLPTREFTGGLLGIAVGDVASFPFDQSPPMRSLDYLVQAEVIAGPTNVFIIVIRRRRRPNASRQNISANAEEALEPSKLTVHSAGPYVHSHEFDQLKRFLSEAFSVQLEEFQYTAGEFDALKAEGRISPEIPSEDDIAAAEVLSDPIPRITR